MLCILGGGGSLICSLWEVSLYSLGNTVTWIPSCQMKNGKSINRFENHGTACYPWPSPSFIYVPCSPVHQQGQDYVLNRILWNGVLLSFLSTTILAIILGEKHCSQYRPDFCIEKGLLCASWYKLFWQRRMLSK